MSKDQGKKKAKTVQKQAPATKDKKKITPAELTDADLDKVSGGTTVGSATGGAGSGKLKMGWDV
jgi:hypothetical protein